MGRIVVYIGIFFAVGHPVICPEIKKFVTLTDSGGSEGLVDHQREGREWLLK
jgi:hypothetical protein